MKTLLIKKYFGILLFLLTLVIFSSIVISCPDNEQDNKSDFSAVPVLSVSAINGGIVFSFTDSEPAADVYDVYWSLGDADFDTLKSKGTKVSQVLSYGFIIGLNDGQIYSVAVIAQKDGYKDNNSTVSTIRPGKKLSQKRGVGYGFNFPRPSNSGSGPGHNNPAIIIRDMDLLGQGITWWYSWATNPGNVVSPIAAEKELPFVPMVWGAGNNFATYLSSRHASALDDVRTYVNNYPGVEFLLAYNEPNFTQEANMTPAQAAQVWPALVTRARELKLKIVSPAMNYGTMSGYSNPTRWMEEFFGTDGHPGFENISLNDIDAVAIHLYNDFGNNVRTYIDQFRKFGKPVWMTEWCAWDDKSGVYFTTPEFQINFASQSVIYMEHDPGVERYAWYIPKGGEFNHETRFPWNKLLTGPEPPALPELTPLGLVYVHMSALDKNLYYIPGETIPAKDFSNGNLSELAPNVNTPYIANTAAWRDGVRFRPATDNAVDASVLDIVFYSPTNNTLNMWVEYQIAVLETRDYDLSIRYSATQDMNFQITVNEGYSQDITLNQSTNWTTKTQTLNLPLGKNTIRIRKTTPSGSCAINWLKVE